MPQTLTAPQVLNREFLEIRAKILEVAASLDRLDRAEGSVSDDPRRRKIEEAIRLLNDLPESRAEQVQLLFSREYDDAWPAKFGMSTGR